MLLKMLPFFFLFTQILFSEHPLYLLTIPKSGSHLIHKILKLTQEEYKEKYSYTTWYHPGYYKDSKEHQYERPDCPERIYENPTSKKIIMVRDLRDCICSGVFYFNLLLRNPKTQKSFMFRNMQDWHHLTFLEKAELLINEEKSCCKWSNLINDINYFLDTPNTLLIKFEDIIGLNGNGCQETQLKTLKKLLTFLEIEFTNEFLENLAKKVFGRSFYDIGSVNFRKGQIGDYKNHLNKEIINKIEQNYRDFLIKFNYLQTF